MATPGLLQPERPTWWTAHQLATAALSMGLGAWRWLRTGHTPRLFDGMAD